MHEPPKKKPFQFSLKSLFYVTTLAAIYFAMGNIIGPLFYKWQAIAFLLLAYVYLILLKLGKIAAKSVVYFSRKSILLPLILSAAWTGSLLVLSATTIPFFSYLHFTIVEKKTDFPLIMFFYLLEYALYALVIMAVCATVLAIVLYPLLSRLVFWDQDRKMLPMLLLLPFGALCGGVTCWLLLHSAISPGTTYLDTNYLFVVLPIITASPSAIILTALWSRSHAQDSIGVSTKAQTPREQIDLQHHKHDVI